MDTFCPGPLWIRFIQLRQRQEAELRPRIALHLSGRVRVPASATSISDNLADCKRVILLIINMLRRNLSVRSYEKTYHLAGRKSRLNLRILLALNRLRSIIIIHTPARSSKNSAGQFISAGVVSDDKNSAGKCLPAGVVSDGGGCPGRELRST